MNIYAKELFIVALMGALSGCVSQPPAPVVGPGDQPSTTAPQNVYVVKRGDTLYSISREYGVGPRELAAANAIENPDQLAVGQTLKIPVVSATTAVAEPIGTEASGVESRPLDTAGAASSVVLMTEPKAGKEAYSDEALARARGAGGETVTSAPVAVEENRWAWPADGKILRNYNGNDNKGVDIGGRVGAPIVAAEGGRVILVSNTLRSYGNMVIVSHGAKLVTVYAHNSKILVKEKQPISRGQKIAEMGRTDAGQVMLHFEVRNNGEALDPLKYLPARAQ
ncbi:MAG: peptidoglycan DD-metalloendopeptidase family protein [Candidatus Accumulibacter sp.]|jgi:lipoprotein NlpD|nr:peptidoglycan DD-metalloendopeptidase family protein [Accumulibacter sp.]